MSGYQGLARIYDHLMAGVDYQAWADYIKELADRHKVTIKSALDLACGTGNTSMLLAKFDWRVTGVDLSVAMLQRARKKAAEAGLEIIFLQQDIRDLQLSQKYDLVTCFQDGLNYLLETAELRQTFLGVYKALNPGGLFIFDLNLVGKFAAGQTGETNFIDTEDYSLVYETDYLYGTQYPTSFCRGEKIRRRGIVCMSYW